MQSVYNSRAQGGRGDIHPPPVDNWLLSELQADGMQAQRLALCWVVLSCPGM